MPNNLPQGWVECELRDVILKLCNGTSAKQNKNGIGIPVTRIETISNCVININRVGYIDSNNAEILENYKLNNGDILFSNINSDSHLGKTAIFNLEKLILHGMNLLLIRTNQKILLSEFLNYYFNYCRVAGRFIKIAQHAVNQSSINQKKLNLFKIVLPPLNEQRRIVEKIEHEFEKIDKGIDYLTLTKEQIKQYRQSVLKSAFEGKLYKTTEWNNYELKDVCKNISAGGDKPEIYSEIQTESCKIPIYSNGIQNNGLYGYTNVAKIVEPAVTVSARGTIGFVCVREQPYLPIVRLISVIPDTSILNIDFLKYFLNHIVPKGEGSSIPQLTVPNFKKYIITLPSLIEQQQIVKEIEKRFKIAGEVEKIVEENLEKAKQLKQSILKKAFEGKLVPQDPNDEPASVLLERIKVERNK